MLALIVIVVLGLSNWWAFRALKPAPVAASGELSWDAFGGITGKPGAWTFPDTLTRWRDQPVTIVGVLVPHAGMRAPDGEHLLGAYFAPPSRLSCCSLTCDVRPQFTCLLDFSAPESDPKTQIMARVRGVLRLDPTLTGWAATTLDNAVIERVGTP